MANYSHDIQEYRRSLYFKWISIKNSRKVRSTPRDIGLALILLGVFAVVGILESFSLAGPASGLARAVRENAVILGALSLLCSYS